MELPDLATSIAASEDEDAARQLLRDADIILRGRIADAPSEFVAQVFAGAAPEDLVHYHASEIAEIAESTWRFLDERRLTTPKIRVRTPPRGQRLNNVSIVEILNDDMPFLVDSVMAELTEQGIDPHLVLHPRFIVERNPGGTLIGLPALPAPGAAFRPESLIQVHVDRIDSEDARNALIIALDTVLAGVR